MLADSLQYVARRHELSYKRESGWCAWDLVILASTIALLCLICELYLFEAGVVQRRWCVLIVTMVCCLLFPRPLLNS